MRFREMQQQLRQKDEISRVEKLEELKHAEIIELQTKLSEAVERDQQERQAEYQRHLMDENKNVRVPLPDALHFCPCIERTNVVDSWGVVNGLS
jgi:hypothetical protein